MPVKAAVSKIHGSGKAEIGETGKGKGSDNKGTVKGTVSKGDIGKGKGVISTAKVGRIAQWSQCE